MALCVERLDDLDDAGDRLGGPRLGHWRAGVERLHVAVKARGLGGGKFEVVDTQRPGLRQDRVVDIGDVAHEPHRVAEILEPPDEQVVGEVGVRVPEMRRVVRGDAAHVDVDNWSGCEGHHSASRSVEESHWHGREGSNGAGVIAPDLPAGWFDVTADAAEHPTRQAR